jgi:hypothetical protein
MCDVNKIAAIVLSSTITLAAAIVAFGVGALIAGSIWTAGGNAALMTAVAIALALAIGQMNIALLEAAKCIDGPCKRAAEELFGALFALIATMSALLTATVIAAFGASVPYFGVGVAIALAVSALLVAGRCCSSLACTYPT